MAAPDRLRSKSLDDSSTRHWHRGRPRPVIGGNGEHPLLGWGNIVVEDYLRGDAAGGLDTESQEADVDEEGLNSVLLAGDDKTLETSAPNDGLVGVDSLRRFLAVEGVLEERLNLGDTKWSHQRGRRRRCLSSFNTCSKGCY